MYALYFYVFLNIYILEKLFYKMSIHSDDTIYTIGGFHKTTTTSLALPNFTNTNHIDIYNVRISPQKITFTGAFDGKKFIEQVTVQNLGNKKVVIRFGTPTSFVSFNIYISLFIYF